MVTAAEGQVRWIGFIGSRGVGGSSNFRDPIFVFPMCSSSEPPYGQSSIWKFKMIYLITTS